MMTMVPRREEMVMPLLPLLLLILMKMTMMMWTKTNK